MPWRVNTYTHRVKRLSFTLIEDEHRNECNFPMKCVHLPYVQQPWLCHQTDDEQDTFSERCMLMTQILIFWIELIHIHEKKIHS